MQRQYLLPTLNEQEYMILPESIGWYWDEPGHEVNRKVGTLNNFSIHFILSGSGFVEIDGKQYSLKRGDAFLYFPMQEQRYYSSKNNPWNIRWVHFYGSILNQFLSERGFYRFSLWNVQHVPTLEKAHEQLLLEAEENSFLHLSRLSTLTYTFLMEFITNVVPRRSDRRLELNDRIQVLLPIMQSKACDPFELDYWAEQAGVSTYYFCRLFKRATQMTPMEFITLCRLQKSKQLLLDNKELTIKEIAIKTGYPSISYFNKRFLEQESMTPTEYRQLYFHKKPN
ncbi:AraC family transcriptional regulator [Metabacillus arenae]|uniref:Helix-turn-helix domain-containing protein n=1 Tax=Metabacillus arenae TaxID=2771434 RepID=A0A926NF33_9BACI|nr:helix-turn-helix domain-containing protein [Metabacillus arenae]MBD1380379.1 helix-turn-helix domain-containing protein [Metabacillus arenae]